MRKLLAKALRTACASVGAYPTYLTGEQELRACIRKLRPRHFEQGLIRLGPAGDGGYLVPDDLAGISTCFSPGVADISGFERDCAERGMKVFMADYSVEKPADWHEAFHFTRKFLGAVGNEQFMTLDSWVQDAVGDDDDELILQMDIEGFEYEVLLSTSDRLLRRFRIIIAEFHDLHLLWSRPHFNFASRALEKLLQTHSCVHIHPNNQCGSQTLRGLEIPRVAELTFIRKDRVSGEGFVTSFPHEKDIENADTKPLELPAWWYKDER
jgi:hypothetical protein